MFRQRHVVTFAHGREQVGRRLLSAVLALGTFRPLDEYRNWESIQIPADRVHLYLEGLGILSIELELAEVSFLKSVSSFGSLNGVLDVEADSDVALPPVFWKKWVVPTKPVGTWALEQTGVLTSPFTGKAIRVGVLDTAFDGSHPDFVGRDITACSFVGENPCVADKYQSHGTACLGLACGARTTYGPRYGVATEATIYFGQVMDRNGSGSKTSLLAGINWMVAAGCDVVSISMAFAEPLASAAFEKAGSIALSRECLLIAGAGNLAALTVCQPANSRGIMAIGSVGEELQPSTWSCRSGQFAGAQVDLCGPGERILTALPNTETYGTVEEGTSYAAPIVAGIAALWAERAGKRGCALWKELVHSARDIKCDRGAVGAGLAMAPQR